MKNFERYNEIEKLYTKIQDNYEKIEYLPMKRDQIHEETIKLIDKTSKMIEEIELKFDGVDEEEQIMLVNLSDMKEDLYYLKNSIEGIMNYSDIIKPLEVLIKKNGVSQIVKDNFNVDTNQELAAKIADILTHPSNVVKYQNYVDKILRGSMSSRTFEMLLDVIQSNLISKLNIVNNTEEKRYNYESMKKHEIQSLDDFLNEGFFNPFEEDDQKEKKPKAMGDVGGIMKPRKEYFNQNRIEFTRRAGGDYTLMSKTQFAKGEVVEICPTLILGIECKSVDKLKDIVFELDRENSLFALVFGYGSMYRHSLNANCEYAYNKSTRQMYFLAKRFIKVGEELTINYGEDFWQAKQSYNLMAKQESPAQVANKEGTDKNESSTDVQPNLVDTTNSDSSKTLSNPQNKQNPSYTGTSIPGGQS